MRPFVLTVLAACAHESEPFETIFPMDGVTTVSADLERGRFAYRGTITDRFQVQGIAEARAGGAEEAARRLATIDHVEAIDGDRLSLTATTPEPGCTVEYDVVGPQDVDVEVSVDGLVDVESIRGHHVLRGSQVVGYRMYGSLTASSTMSGMDVEVWPDASSTVTLDSTAGDVVLRLPYGLDYDVQVLGDPSFEMYVTDLGFSTSQAEAGYFAGIVGSGTVPVRVTLQGGSFQLIEAF